MKTISSMNVDAEPKVSESITTLNFGEDLKEIKDEQRSYSYGEFLTFNRRFAGQVRALCSLWNRAVSVLEISPKIDRNKFWLFLKKIIPETGTDGKFESFAKVFLVS